MLSVWQATRLSVQERLCQENGQSEVYMIASVVDEIQMFYHFLLQGSRITERFRPSWVTLRKSPFVYGSLSSSAISPTSWPLVLSASASYQAMA